MQKCEKCGVKIADKHNRCPLCQGDLIGESSGRIVFPHIKNNKNIFMNIVKLVEFCSIAAIFICYAINLSLGDTWWIYVAAGVGSVWLVAGMALKMRYNIPKCIIWSTGLSVVVAVAWDFATVYKGWSVDFVLPVACCCGILAIAIIARIKKQRIEDIIAYMILDIIFGIIPLVLILFGSVTTMYPSAICVATSAISLTALFIFKGKSLIAEITRRTHM